MEPHFWHQRWQSARIGFHQREINPHLRACWQHTGAPPNTEVLVPLCGKSRDMYWLAEQGHAVAGFELSPLAIADFFAEAKLTPKREPSGLFVCWQHEPFRLYEGDFFHADALGRQFDLAYDRAALIALPATMRPAYAALLARLNNPGGRVLLVTVDHDAQAPSPPFAVNEAEVRTLFEPCFEVALLAHLEEGARNRRVAAGECTFFDEWCFLLTRR
ncbi:thiopurine S-methyltransferase [Oceanimonas sp. GK1]|uniref:thiopurine S-methyltransferase n=1 Tax=Oceanimonas sp. (strain GK1 / IBRC-M 10197) TaxID=511062 RepID=UPI0002495655|nr:thiopurine S-methyltransferase [Oceanimonas sp. GK1]AEY02072.1 thiopurine S-methyltransferase [Oceanimonas sp. GK1]